MPVVRRRLDAATRPEWSKVTGAGIFTVPRDGGTFDRHYHDCDEYWLIFAGKAKVSTEGETFYVRAGDIVCTRAGDEHDVIEVYEDLAAWFFEDALKPQGAAGHLHYGEASRHAVPSSEVPVDFPVDS